MCRFLCVSTSGESVVPEQEDEVEESEGRAVVFAQRSGKRRHWLGRLAKLWMNGGGRTQRDGGSTGHQLTQHNANLWKAAGIKLFFLKIPLEEITEHLQILAVVNSRFMSIMNCILIHYW